MMSKDAATETGFIKTTTHNYVSRTAEIEGPRQVELKGRPIPRDDVVVHGDKAVVRIGRYCDVGEKTVLSPPPHPLQVGTHVPMVLGSYIRVGKECRIHAAAVRSMVWIGDGVTLGERAIVKDNCYIDSGVTIGDDAVIVSFSVYLLRVPVIRPNCRRQWPWNFRTWPSTDFRASRSSSRGRQDDCNLRRSSLLFNFYLVYLNLLCTHRDWPPGNPFMLPFSYCEMRHRLTGENSRNLFHPTPISSCHTPRTARHI